MEIALMYESQLKKLIAELGESVMDSIEEINYVNEQTRERYLNRNWAVVSLTISSRKNCFVYNIRSFFLQKRSLNNYCRSVTSCTQSSALDLVSQSRKEHSAISLSNLRLVIFFYYFQTEILVFRRSLFLSRIMKSLS